MIYLTASVEDRQANIAGRYICQSGENQLKALAELIRADWKVMNNYIPNKLSIAFEGPSSPEDIAQATPGELITALEG